MINLVEPDEVDTRKNVRKYTKKEIELLEKQRYNGQYTEKEIELLEKLRLFVRENGRNPTAKDIQVVTHIGEFLEVGI